MEFNQSFAFIEEKGSVLEKARLRSILYGIKPSPEIVQPLMELQNTDGGFPFNLVKGNHSAVGDTLLSLSYLNDLKMLKSPTAVSALHYLLTVQSEDGSWDENPEIAKYNPPPWMIPGDRRAIVFNTAYSAFWLVVAEFTGTTAFKRAYEFLVKCQSESGKLEGFLHSTWIGTSVFAMVEGWESGRVQRGIQYLDNIDSSQWVASQIAWLLGCFASAGVPKENAFVRKMLKKLSEGQREDGRFASEDGDEFAVNATIEAIKVMLLWREET